MVEKYLSSDCSDSCYASGFDLFCPKNIICQNGKNNQYILDHKISCAMMYKGKYVGYYLYMRSSTPVKTPLRLANNVGIIDSGYRGNIKACFDIVGCINDDDIFRFEEGIRYIQLCPPDIGKPLKVIIVDSMLDENNNRGFGGFGSTGN